MPFWSRKSKSPALEDASTSSRRSTFDERFGTRNREMKQLRNEIDDLVANLHSLDLHGLNQLEEKALAVLRIRQEHLSDLAIELKQEPYLLEAFPTLPTMLDKYADEAELALMWARRHREARFPGF